MSYAQAAGSDSMMPDGQCHTNSSAGRQIAAEKRRAVTLCQSPSPIEWTRRRGHETSLGPRASRPRPGKERTLELANVLDPPCACETA